MLGGRMDYLILANGGVTIVIEGTNSQSLLVHRVEAGSILNAAL